MLQSHGLFLGEVHVRDSFNLKGNRENDRIVALNNAVLEHSGGAWNAPPAVLSWTSVHEHLRDSIIGAFDLEACGAWGFKDPRLIFTLPFWLPAIAGRARFVGTFRHPSQVIRSLCSRGRMSLTPDDAGFLWLAYNRRLLDFVDRFDIPLVSFDLPSQSYRARIDTFAMHLGLPGVPDHPDPGFFEEDLRSDTGDCEEFAATKEQSELHDELLAKALLLPTRGNQ